MTAKVKLLWTRRIQRRKNKPYIAAKTYIVKYDGTLANPCTVLAYTIRRRQRLIMVIVDYLLLARDHSGKSILVPVGELPEVNEQHSISYLPCTRTKPLNHE